MSMGDLFAHLRAMATASAPLERDSTSVAEGVWLLVLSFAGGIIGALGGAGLTAQRGAPGPAVVLGGLFGFFIGVAFVHVATRLILAKAESLAAQIYNPSGRTTPSRPEYSLAASLAVRGRFEEAIEAYERCLAENPEDPEPCLRIARLLRDELRRYEEAITWFRKARGLPTIEPGQEILATREIVEIYTSKLGTPAKAAPELARMAQRFAGTPTGEWARRELQEIKKVIARESRDGA